MSHGLRALVRVQLAAERQEASLGRNDALQSNAAGKDPEALTDNALKRCVFHLSENVLR